MYFYNSGFQGHLFPHSATQYLKANGGVKGQTSMQSSILLPGQDLGFWSGVNWPEVDVPETSELPWFEWTSKFCETLESFVKSGVCSKFSSSPSFIDGISLWKLLPVLMGCVFWLLSKLLLLLSTILLLLLSALLLSSLL